MKDSLRFLIIDGYPEQSRDELKEAGMSLAWKLYVDMLLAQQPGAAYDVLLPADPGVKMPSAKELEVFDGVIWTGCNLCVNDTDNPAVSCQIELAGLIYEVGLPSFGSCWALQVGVVAAGGEVKANPKGREMGMSRKIYQTAEGLEHPMFEGRPHVFEAFTSHDDIVTRMPKGGVVLAGNSFTSIQAAEITHKSGTLWATQYHPEYTLHEMARLIVAREEKLTDAGFFRDHKDLAELVDRMEALALEPGRKDLRWQLAIDDDVLTDSVRQCEFKNWIEKQVLPK